MAKRELHNAIVTRNVERTQGLTLALRGAVYFNAPTLFEGEFPQPALPCFQFASLRGAGIFFVPKVGDEIEIEIQGDDPNTPYDADDVENPEPRYRCMVYSDAADIHDIFKVNYPFRMGWASNSGHYLLFDDASGKELVKLFHKVGTFMEMNKDGDMIQSVVRDMILTVMNNQIENIEFDSTTTIGGKKIFNVSGDCEINCNNAKVVAGNNVELTAGGKIVAMAPQIELNGAASPATSVASHLGVIDQIVGAPINATTTVFLDV